MSQDPGSRPQTKPQLGFPIVLILGGLIVLLASLGVFGKAWGWLWPAFCILLGGILLILRWRKAR
ncbi:MAG: hypothetical protein NTV33_08340 [Coprothermobacterota bacterium]|nr:hypothetical protein [Coprothermobacterota bacterium]